MTDLDCSTIADTHFSLDLTTYRDLSTENLRDGFNPILAHHKPLSLCFPNAAVDLEIVRILQRLGRDKKTVCFKGNKSGKMIRVFHVDHFNFGDLAVNELMKNAPYFGGPLFFAVLRDGDTANQRGRDDLLLQLKGKEGGFNMAGVMIGQHLPTSAPSMDPIPLPAYTEQQQQPPSAYNGILPFQGKHAAQQQQQQWSGYNGTPTQPAQQRQQGPGFSLPSIGHMLKNVSVEGGMGWATMAGTMAGMDGLLGIAESTPVAKGKRPNTFDEQITPANPAKIPANHPSPLNELQDDKALLITDTATKSLTREITLRWLRGVMQVKMDAVLIGHDGLILLFDKAAGAAKVRDHIRGGWESCFDEGAKVDYVNAIDVKALIRVDEMIRLKDLWASEVEETDGNSTDKNPAVLPPGTGGEIDSCD
ncbi:hypothetical protein HK097_003880, partial [Rhizophlyctis rosea]